MISPSMSGLTLVHSEDDVGPRCSVIFGGGRMGDTGLIDSRRIELTFDRCESSKFCVHGDQEELDSKGYVLRSAARNAERSRYLKWFQAEWLYVVAGRNGYAELIAAGFSWREWIWNSGKREDVPASSMVVAQGTSDAQELPREA